MPTGDNQSDYVTSEWLCHELRYSTNQQQQQQQQRPGQRLLILDCRNVQDYTDGHIRGSVALAIPSIMLRRLAAGKVDLLSTIKCLELRTRVELLLGVSEEDETSRQQRGCFVLVGEDTEPQGETVHVLARRLKCCGGAVALLQGGFKEFKDRYPEWCENSQSCTEGQTNVDSNEGDLMGLRTLRISTPSTRAFSDSDSDSTCDSLVIRKVGPEEDKDFPVEIVQNLYLGNAANSEDSESLARHGITYILNVTPDLPNVFQNGGSIKYMQIPVSDHWSQNVAEFFPQAIEFIDEARNSSKGVLVHCLAGISRSVTVTVAYLMHRNRMTMNDAFNLVRTRKSNIAPNFHFLQQLAGFERELQEERKRNGSSSSYGSGSNNGANSARSTVSSADCSSCPATSFLSPLDVGLSPDSGIEFDRWASSSTPAE